MFNIFLLTSNLIIMFNKVAINKNENKYNSNNNNNNNNKKKKTKENKDCNLWLARAIFSSLFRN